VLGGAVSNWIDTSAIIEKEDQINSLREENRELIYLLEEGNE